MRILLLTPEYLGSGGGIKTFYRNLLPALVKGGVEAHAIEGSAFHHRREASAHVRQGVHVQTLERPRLERWYTRFGRFEAAPGLRRHLAATWAIWEQAGFGDKFDVVEACDWGLLFVAPVVKASGPVVVQCHGSIGQIAEHDPIAGEEAQDALVQLIERAGMSFADAVQSYSAANAGFWSREVGRSVDCIHPAWTASAPVEHDGLGSRGLVVGRVQRWKGPQIVCDALRRMGGNAPQIDWIGRDTAWGARGTSSMAHLAQAYPGVWGEIIAPLPPVSPDEVARRQAGALFNLVPSTWDVFNFTAVEALGSGRPTIVSTGAGASELVEDGVNGFTFDAGDPELLAATLDKLMAHSSRRLQEIGQNGRETVRLALDPDKIAEIRVEAYRSTAVEYAAKSGATCSPWLNELLTPGDDNYEETMSFLDHHPLRSILKYALLRCGRKIVGVTATVGDRP